MLRRRSSGAAWALAAVLCAAGAAGAQAATSSPDQVRVFVDCSYFCDMDYMRTELTWVDYMRDRADAQVHVLVTRQGTGAGGALFTLEFIGLRQFAARADTLTYVSGPNDTSDVTRRGLTRLVKLGLAPYAARTGAAERLDVTYAAAGPVGAEGPPVVPSHDPWNYWTFRAGMSGSSSGESNQGSDRWSGNLSANRTTPVWKVELGTSGSYNESRFQYEIGGERRSTTSIRRSYSGNALVVRSLGPHLSAGVRSRVGTSTFGNTKLSVELAPAIEYNFVPYAESTRRSFVLQYAPGFQHADYREVTIYGQEVETRPVHTVGITYSTRQPWGSMNVGLNGSQYLHDSSKYNAGLSGSTDIRLFRGFSFNLGGMYSHVRDQLSLPRRDLTEEEVLLRQRQLATNYTYYVFGGISYRFGSIFSNIVNPRMRATSGGEIIFM
jgi:hypothetical protein